MENNPLLIRSSLEVMLESILTESLFPIPMVQVGRSNGEGEIDSYSHDDYRNKYARIVPSPPGTRAGVQGVRLVIILTSAHHKKKLT